jgi:hypothetical protein
MKKSASSIYVFMAFFSSAILMLSLLTTCGGGGGGESSSSPSTGTVVTHISDPPTCQNDFQNVWVTVTRIRAHQSSSAGPNENGWVDLIDLTDTPMQLDLMNLAQTECVSAQLGSTGGIPAGKYQQIRLYLLTNNPSEGTAVPKPNNCAGGEFTGFNCVVNSSGIQALQLSSEVQTGIKIPSGQIAGGNFVVPAGQVVDLDIDFDACSSIVREGNGQFRLKPVLHAAEVSFSDSINGKVVDSVSRSPIPGAVVFLEQVDQDGIDRMIMQTLTKSDGTFFFCPIPAGIFVVVADALIPTPSGNTAYNATVTFGVPSGAALGNIPIIAEMGADTSPATITGQISTTTGTTAVQADISLSALQLANDILVTVPPLGSSAPNVTTTSGSCPANNDCAEYVLIVPAGNPSIGTFSVTPPTSYSTPATIPASINYTVNAQAFTPMTSSSGNAGGPDCNPSSLFASLTGTDITPGKTFLLNFDFTECQQ